MTILRKVQQILETERAFGVEAVPTRLPVGQPGGQAAVGKKAAIEELRLECLSCRRCPLAATRRNVVFGAGDFQARLMFVGEAPGYDEDLQGAPFVGLAGQLLTRIIEAMKLKRQDVFIANCLKCRPPNNRNPILSEIACCSPYLMKQIEIIRPVVICALGKFAAQTILKTEEPISRLRGRFFEYMGIKLMPTFHPAYLLRNPADKKLVWQDVRQIMKVLGI